MIRQITMTLLGTIIGFYLYPIIGPCKNPKDDMKISTYKKILEQGDIQAYRSINNNPYTIDPLYSFIMTNRYNYLETANALGNFIADLDMNYKKGPDTTSMKIFESYIERCNSKNEIESIIEIKRNRKLNYEKY